MMQQHKSGSDPNFFIILLIALFLSGCVQLPKKSGYSKLRPLCEKDAGLTIHKTVKAKGYFDPERDVGFTTQIIFNGFEFIEFCTEKPIKRSAFSTAGCWRVEKIARDKGPCNKEIDRRLKSYVLNGYAEFLKDSCLSVEKIDLPSSRYSYINHSDSWEGANNISNFRRTESHILDNVTEKSVADYITYSYSARPGLDPYIFCDDVDGKYVSMRGIDFVNSVIFP